MNCSERPAPLELRLTNDPDAFDPYAGNVVTLSIGEPYQQVKLTPAAAFLNSGVHVTPPCSNSSDSACNPLKYGGVFNSLQSTTYVAAAFTTWNGSHDAGQTTLQATYFNELMKFADGTRLSGVPLVGLDNTLDIPNVLGLGPNSTVVTQAYTAGLTTSKAWSFYAGTATTPGSLILGGYSNEFASGSLSGRDSDPSCPICFQVASISFDSINGTIPILKAGQAPFMASLEPVANWLAFPDSVFNDFVRLMNSTGVPQSFPTFNNSSVPSGNLTITLGNGIKVSIGSNELFTNRPLNSNGTIFTPSPGTQVAKVQRSLFSTGALGFPYLSHVYFMYDDERRTVNISNAAAGATSNGQITRICPLSASTSSNNNSTSPSQDSSSHSYAGPIAGAVVGFVALLAAVVTIVFLVLRHKRNYPHRRSTSDASNLPLEKDSHNTTYPMSVFSASDQERSTYRQVTHSPVEIYDAHKDAVPTISPTYELPSSTMRGPADLSYERYELPSETVNSTETHKSWGGSTIAARRNTASPETPHAKVSPQWNYI